MKSRLLGYALATLLLASAPRPQAEVVIGGVGGLSWDTLIDPGAFLDSASENRLYFYPLLYAGSDNFEFSFEGAISYTSRETQPAFAVRQLSLSTFPFEFLTVRLGRFDYLPGSAEFFSCSNFFNPMDLEALIYQRDLDFLQPADLLQLTVLFWEAYLRISASTFVPQRPFPEPESPWFPMKDIPGTLLVPLPSPHEMTLGTVSVKAEAEIPANLSSISLCAEGGLSLYGIDLALLYYQGWDVDLITTSEILFPTGFFGSFDVEITPITRYIRAVALDLATSISALRLWLDSSFTFQKSFNTSRLSSDALSTLLAQQHYWEYTVGASYELSRLKTTLLAEFKGDLVVPSGSGSEDALVKNLLSCAFVGSARSAFFDSRMIASVLVLVSTADGSTAMQLALSYEPSSELRFVLYSPLFFGGLETELGQFSGNHLVSAAVQWRF
jgi:hypothetical protein